MGSEMCIRDRDKELYKVVSDEIQTDEVIITNQQILHVNEGHPGTYERFAPHLQTVLEAPDYILRGNRPNTALVIKNIFLEDAAGSRLEIVLRLKVSGDPENYSNSIISMWHISDKRYRRLLRQSEVLYKRE